MFYYGKIVFIKINIYMKTVKHIKYKSQLMEVECLKCGKTKLIHKHYYKNNMNKYRQFCSEMCKIYYDDPKQEHIMDYIDTSNFHYLVGLIATDGHIAYPGCTKTTKSYYCNIKLNSIDSELLYKIQKIFGGGVTEESVSGFNKNSQQTVWRVSNKQFIDYLMKIGMTNKKTYNLNMDDYFNSISKENQIAFLRGVIDGDGSICIRDRALRKKPCMGLQCNFNICSASKSFISMLENYFKCGILTERSKSQSKIATCSLYYYYINGAKIVDVLTPIYSTNTDSLVMERKLKVFNTIKNYYSTKS